MLLCYLQIWEYAEVKAQDNCSSIRDMKKNDKLMKAS